MELKIFWTDFSKNELKKIFSYYKENASLRVAKNLISDVFDTRQNPIKMKKSGII